MNETEKHAAKTICLCEDEAATANSIRSLLEAERYKVCVCYTVPQLYKALEYNRFDLLIIDADVPSFASSDCHQKVHHALGAPVVYLASKHRGFEEAAAAEHRSGCLLKPFKARELISMVTSHVVRDSTPASGHESKQGRLRIGGLELDEARYLSTLHGRTLGLTPKEFAILAHLMKADGRPLSPCDLYEAVWNEAPDSRCNNTVMVHIRHLRQKLRAADPSHEYIETVWGVGYRIT